MSAFFQAFFCYLSRAPLTIEVKENPRIVPKGEQLDRNAFKSELPSDKCRVIREFVADIFDLHITEALKVSLYLMASFILPNLVVPQWHFTMFSMLCRPVSVLIAVTHISVAH